MVTGSARIDIERALIDPDAVFASPREVLEHDGLSTEQKAEILRRWASDAAQIALAVDEGMPGNESDLLRQSLLALQRLNEGVAAGFPVHASLPPRKNRS